MCSPAAHCHPGFPATEVNGKLYWDGGCVSNTPLDAVVDEPGHPHMVVFLIDLWDAAGAPPQTINAVLWRAKQIQYASRTAHQVDAVATKVNLRRAVRLLKAAGVPDVAAVPDDALLTARRLDIVHIVYRRDADQIPTAMRSSPAARSPSRGRRVIATSARHWRRSHGCGRRGRRISARWLHRVGRGPVTTRPEPNLRTMIDKPAAA